MLLSPRAEEEKDAASSVHARNRVLSPHAEEAEEDAEDASAPCGLLSSCAEEDAPPSAFDPCGQPDACTVGDYFGHLPIKKGEPQTLHHDHLISAPLLSLSLS